MVKSVGDGSSIEEIHAKREIENKYLRWRKWANNRIPNIAARVFALRNKTDHNLERDLGKVLIGLNDQHIPRTYKERWEDRQITQILFSILLEDIRKFEGVKK